MSIWNYPKISSLIEPRYQLNLGEGNTSLLKIFLDKYEQRELGIKDPNATKKIYLKLETENPNNSFKDRSLAFQISYYNSEGVKNLLISSSGNAATAAASYVSLADNLRLAVFISNHINPKKLEKLQEIVNHTDNVSLNFSERPKSAAIKYSRAGNFINLRGSADETAIIGFKTISYELIKQAPEIDAVFVPCSSATSTNGIYQGYKDLEAAKLLEKKVPAMHVCQTTKINPIAKEFDLLFEESATSVADAIVDRVALRKQQTLSLIKETGGSGWVLSDEEISKALKFLQTKTKIPNLTVNGTLSFAGLIKAMKRRKIFEAPVCIISGI